MVKAPSQNGLHSKFKSWRRGKSTKAKNAGRPSSSLKQQLRGLQRLQAKKSGEGDAQQLAELQEKINALQQQMDTRGASEKERVNAKKSHKMRFIERQRTTRLYKQLVKQQREDATTDEEKVKLEHELWKLALDQVYIAHYPLDQTSYLSLFQNGSSIRRQVMNSRLLFKMASQRKRVLEQLAVAGSKSVNPPSDTDNEDIAPGIQRATWIHPSQYERIQSVTTWSTNQERETFGVTTEEQSAAAATAATLNDSRFRTSGASQSLLEQQEKLERELDDDFAEAAATTAKKSTGSDLGDSSSSDSDDDGVDPLTRKPPSSNQQEKQEMQASSYSDSTSSDDEIEEAAAAAAAKVNLNRDASDDDSSSSSDSSDDESVQSDKEDDVKLKEKLATTTALRDLAARHVRAADDDDHDDDDFLVEAPENTDVFANAKRHVPAKNEGAGDKSKGWATQRQLPGQFRKKQRR